MQANIHWYILCTCFALMSRPRDAASSCMQFTIVPVDTPALIGEGVYLYCDYPNSTSETWSTNNGVTIQSAQLNPCNCFPQTNGTGSALYFPSVSSGDYKTYTCSIQIGFGLSCQVTAAIRIPVPPVLTAVGSSSQTASQGSTVTFSVNLATPGLPLASVVWTKDGVSLYNTTNMIVTSIMLQLSNITALSKGRYIATAINKAGSSALNFDLFVKYLAVRPITVSASNNQIELTCLADGYPRVNSVVWRNQGIVLPSTSSFMMADAYTWTASSSLVVGADCNQVYQCMVTSMEQMLLPIQQNMTACPSVVSSLSTKPLGPNGVLLLWQPIPTVTSYSIRYGIIGSARGVVGPTVSCQTSCNATLSGLTLGSLYIFTVENSNQVLTASAVITAGLGPVTAVSAIIANDTSLNQVALSWYNVPTATGYLIYVDGVTLLSVAAPATMATISLVCGEQYTFQVQAYNEGSLSTVSAPVLMLLDYCTMSPRITSVMASGLVVRVQFTNVGSDVATTITAVQDLGGVYTYELAQGLADACLDTLVPNMEYTICADFMAPGGSAQDCYPSKVFLGQTGSGVTCTTVLVAKSFQDSRVITAPVPTVRQPWVIGVALVGILGVLATLSCIAGVLYVKRTDEDVIGSMFALSEVPSSIFLSSKTDGLRNSYKCLCRLCMSSSHNISWEQHTGTLERLESTGTQV